MKTLLVVKNEKTGEEYFSDTNPSIIIKKLLNNDSDNNCLKSDYEFEFENTKYVIDNISIGEIIEEEINGFNSVINIYVSII